MALLLAIIRCSRVSRRESLVAARFSPWLRRVSECVPCGHSKCTLLSARFGEVSVLPSSTRITLDPGDKRKLQEERRRLENRIALRGREWREG